VCVEVTSSDDESLTTGTGEIVLQLCVSCGVSRREVDYSNVKVVNDARGVADTEPRDFTTFRSFGLPEFSKRG
jgi:hypothetical protein